MTSYHSQHPYGFPPSHYAGRPGNGKCEDPHECSDSSRKAQEAPKRLHSDHPNCPDSLNCLPDTDEKPNHILPVIVRSAILGSTKKRLTLRNIYSAVEEKFPYFKTTSTGWKDSIRHNLSLNRLFVKVPRPATEPGFGSYWTVDLNAPPGSKRPRKRGTSNPSAVSLESAKYTIEPSEPAAGPSSLVMAVPYSFDPEYPNSREARSSHSGSEFEAEEDNPAEGYQSDYDSEDGEAIPWSYRRGRMAAPVQKPLHPDETPKEMIARLQSELAESRRQFSIASAFALRVSDQLEDAKEHASKIQIKLREAEEQLEEELVARVQVEKKLEEKEELHKEAEGQLKTLLEKGGPGVKLLDAIRSIQDISQRALGR